MSSNAIDRLRPTAGEGEIHVLVESPAGATTKIKWEPALGLFTLSRPLPLGQAYPHDWGFVPGTKAADGDPLDALVLSEGTTYPGLVIRARPIGIVLLEQNAEGGGRERNDRLVTVACSAARREVQDTSDLTRRIQEEIEQFFLNVTFFEPKEAVILGWGGPEEAWKQVRSSTRRRNRKK
jgi:inorganic pyrophosphatase